ncbi:hypothetical protein GWK47_019212 [Chionoecetes opilio]|uniref:Uncharacterized protein n=1 Tax=Chionoecetes opilio TaxID=41210 RepID=A0A8J4XQ29_CHIOP|nr:hypothetical protein GWK47_019212 [Chionoecetes opilio]
MPSQRQTLPLGASLRQPSLAGSSKPNQLSLWRYSEILRDTPPCARRKSISADYSNSLGARGGEGCAGVAFTPYLHRLTYTFCWIWPLVYRGVRATDRESALGGLRAGW